MLQSRDREVTEAVINLNLHHQKFLLAKQDKSHSGAVRLLSSFT